MEAIYAIVRGPLLSGAHIHLVALKILSSPNCKDFLIYDINIDNQNNVKINMTLTSPNCPVAESLPNEVKNSVKELKDVKNVDLNLVWEPPWDKSMMSESAKLELNL